MAGPSLKRISADDYPEAEPWFRRFLDTINPFIGDTSNSLAGNLTSANFRRQIETVRIDTRPNVSDTFASGGVIFKNKLGTKPVEVRIGQIYPRSSGNTGVIEDVWHAVTFATTWHNFGSINPVAAYMKDSMGWVHVKGVVVGTVADSTIFTFPVGYRPAERSIVPCISNGAFAQLLVEATGIVQTTGGSAVSVCLDSMQFRADTLTAPLSISWDLISNDQIRINYINGLAPSSSYDVTVVIE